jgi:hypothetical protein
MTRDKYSNSTKIKKENMFCFLRKEYGIMAKDIIPPEWASVPYHGAGRT